MAHLVNGSTTTSVKPVSNPPPQSDKMALTLVQKIVVYSLLGAFAIFNWFMFLFIAIGTGAFFEKPTEEDEQDLATGRDQFWNLSKEPIPGFRHAFYRIRSGHQLHFITNRDPSGTKTPGDLIILIHGFPDSSMIWAKLLQEPDIPNKQATLVCVDMPGYGGSDDLEKHDTRVLDVMSEFIVAMRERYTQDTNGNPAASTYVCGHDWGCVVVLRLAAEAPALADRFLTTNGPLISLVQANGEHIVASSAKIFRQFRAAPTKNFGLLWKSYYTLKPLLHQLMLSGYIFVFHLPSFMVKYLSSGGYESFPRGVIKRAAGKDLKGLKVYRELAAVRPGPRECETSLPKSSNKGTTETYGPTVAARSNSTGRAWWVMTGYYRNGASIHPWDKSIETIADLYNLESSNALARGSAHTRRSSSASSALFSEHIKGSLRAPTTMLWGAQDLALSRALCLDGIGDYLAKDSEVIVLPRSGHWTPLEKESRAAFATAIKALIDKPKGTPAPTELFEAVKTTYPDAQLYVRR